MSQDFGNQVEEIGPLDLAEIANRLIYFALAWNVDNEEALIADGEFGPQARAALDQIIRQGYEADLNFIRKMGRCAGVDSFHKEGPWTVNDEGAYRQFKSMWEDLRGVEEKTSNQPAVDL